MDSLSSIGFTDEDFTFIREALKNSKSFLPELLESLASKPNYWSPESSIEKILQGKRSEILAKKEQMDEQIVELNYKLLRLKRLRDLPDVPAKETPLETPVSTE